MNMSARVAGWRRLEPTEDSAGGALFVPDAAGEDLPLVVALHGCRQTAGDFAIGTGFAELAASEGFAVLFPESDRSDAALQLNPLGCWVWWAKRNQTREGEPRLVAGLIDRARAAEPRIGAARACVAGLSSGAAMATILGAVYPDKVRAVASHAGVAFSAAEVRRPTLPNWFEGVPDPAAALALFSPLNWYNLTRWAHESLGAMERPDTDAEDHAHRIIDLRAAHGATYASGALLVVHGDADPTVAPTHARQLVLQALQVADLTDNDEDDDSVDRLADHVQAQPEGPGDYATRRQDYHDGNGRLVARLVQVGTLGHAWSGGSAAGSYTDPMGPDATRITWEFFRDIPAD